MSQQISYSIQEMSRLTGLPSSTLRYYESIDLLDRVVRAENKHRRYTNSDLQRVDLIKKLRLTGMSIEMMCEFVALYRGGPATARKRREILQAHRPLVEARVEELLEMLRFIDFKISLYQEEEELHDERELYNEVSAAG